MAQANWRDRENPDINHLFFHRKEVLAIAAQEKFELQDAISRGLERLSVGVENYPKHRNCFSCHHQSVPLLAYRLNTSRSELLQEDWGKREAIRKGILEFTRASLENELGSLQPEQELGGRGMTLGYALWTMSIGEAKWTQLSGSLVNKALATQQADGRWRIHSVRPPAASSELMATTLVLFGLQHYENNAIQKGDEDIAQARLRASLWRARQPQALNTEDRCAEIWFDYLAKSSFLSMLNVQKDKVGGAGGQPSLYSVASDRIDGKLTPEELQELGDFYTKSRFDQQRKNLIESQNSDGGWGIGLNHESDAYSTATALLILAQSEDYEKFEFVFDKLWFRYGIRYLLNTQKPDGSWHVSSRANPVQEFFDNGDPHDTDQFISIQATAWAVAALACDQHRINDPLGLPLSPVNTGRGYYDRKTATP